MPTSLKKVCLTIIIIAGFLGLTGTFIWFLTADQTTTPSATIKQSLQPTESESTTITICALRDHSFQVALDILKKSDFEEKNKIKIESILLEYDPMTKAHEFNFSEKTSTFDLVSIDQPSLGYYVTKKWVQPLDKFMNASSLPSVNEDDIVPILRQACTQWDQKTYAIPLGSYGALFAYRTDLLSSAGLTVPKTFADYLAFSRRLNDPPNLYGTALFAHEGEYITADTAPFLWSWGAGLINGSDVNLPNHTPYRVAWDTPEGIAALEFYASLFREKLVPPDTLRFDHERYIEAFQSGKIAMGIMPAEGIGAPMEDADKSKVIGKIAYTTLPGRKGKDGSIGSPIAGLGAHSLAISQHSKHPEEAYLVLQYLTGVQIGAEYIRRGGRPFRNSHFSPEALSLYPYMKAMQKGMKTGKFRPNIPEYPVVSKIFYTALHSALTHNASIADVMHAAAVKANSEILIPAYP